MTNTTQAEEWRSKLTLGKDTGSGPGMTCTWLMVGGSVGRDSGSGPGMTIKHKRGMTKYVLQCSQPSSVMPDSDPVSVKTTIIRVSRALTLDDKKVHAWKRFRVKPGMTNKT